MKHFREMNPATARKIDRSMLGLSGVGTLEELEARFIEEAEKILPADCLCWDNWATDLSHQISGSSNGEYAGTFADLKEVFDEVVGYHPVIVAGQFTATAERVMRLSDFASGGEFEVNPLYQEVYRHVDSRHQIAYMPALLEDRWIALTWNRRAVDFTERDREVFYYLGLRLGMVSRRIEERVRLEKNWGLLCGFVDDRLSVGPVSGLGAADVKLLAQLLRCRSRQQIARELGVRGDSLDKQLGAIRERLGLENHQQLLSAIAELKR